jgi:hypothetical protein
MELEYNKIIKIGAVATVLGFFAGGSAIAAIPLATTALALVGKCTYGAINTYFPTSLKTAVSGYTNHIFDDNFKKIMYGGGVLTVVAFAGGPLITGGILGTTALIGGTYCLATKVITPCIMGFKDIVTNYINSQNNQPPAQAPQVQ